MVPVSPASTRVELRTRMITARSALTFFWFSDM